MPKPPGIAHVVAACALTVMTAPAIATQDIRAVQAASELPSGEYRVDPSHTTVVFRVDHLGFSIYTAQFTEIDIVVQLDPAEAEVAVLSVTIPVRSLHLPSPPEGFRDTLLGTDWFDAETYPDMQFVSTGIEMTGETTANIHGDLTLHGITQPVTLSARYNGGWVGHIYDPNARIGFSATAEISRTAFGMGFGTPSGEMPGVADTVQITVETELVGPAWSPAESE
ncbi:MAG: polyisoprenoid-binding protein [Maricaulis sp.]|jgi:polyisoprenoid-binding protein YceI|nr:polyisoprenoid-binding protein [Maricaulis sp.]HAQ34672.1 polyisoprenoid-binding protein [Alphaproteobacteria bacterium]